MLLAFFCRTDCAMPLAPDTSTSQKSLYVAVHHEMLTEVFRDGVLAPCHVMACDENRNWIPLHEDPSDALERGCWGAQEIAKTVSDPKDDLMLLRINFSALGFGFYYLNNMLTPPFYRKSWRFHGEMLVPAAVSRDGHNLATVELFGIA